MQELPKHKKAFEAYFRLRSLVAVGKELGVSRQALGTWKAEFHWDDRCADQDHEVDQLTKEIIVPEWVDLRVNLIRAFSTQITTAMHAGIFPEDSRAMVAVSKELRALCGEGEKVEVEFSGIEYVLTENHKEDSEL